MITIRLELLSRAALTQQHFSGQLGANPDVIVQPTCLALLLLPVDTITGE